MGSLRLIKAKKDRGSLRLSKGGSPNPKRTQPALLGGPLGFTIPFSLLLLLSKNKPFIVGPKRAYWALLSPFWVFFLNGLLVAFRFFVATTREGGTLFIVEEIPLEGSLGGFSP